MFTVVAVPCPNFTHNRVPSTMPIPADAAAAVAGVLHARDSAINCERSRQGNEAKKRMTHTDEIHHLWAECVLYPM